MCQHPSRTFEEGRLQFLPEVDQGRTIGGIG